MKRQKTPMALICAFLLSAMLVVPASANSAQTQWDGTDSTGAIVDDENCPVVVEHENLTFDIQEFPESYYREPESYLAYSGRVTAEYTFHNPADYTVNATLMFPFGAIPDYGHIWDNETEENLRYADTEKYDITVDGTPIDKKLRHTLTFWGRQFELAEDLALLHDGFMEDAFYSPDMPVTRYTYLPSGVDKDTYNAADAAFVLSADPAKTRVYVEGQGGGQTLEDGVRITAWVDLEKGPVVNVIGEPLEQMPEWKFYENGACEKEIDGTMTLVSTETMTLREFALQEYDETSGILDYDWYNAFVSALNYFEWEYGAIHSTEIGFDISDRLMRWYEYELTLEPGQRIVNTVTAPIYPSINSNWEPPIYEYTYLLSPAQTWAEFGTLDIVVNTPFYMIESGTVLDIEKTDSGYAAHLDGLPEGELTFTLCSEQMTKIPANLGNAYPEILLIGAIILFVAVAAVVILIRRKKRRNK